MDPRKTGWTFGNAPAKNNMNRMFFGSTAYNSGPADWDVSSVSDMSSMFEMATTFDGNLSAWSFGADPDVTTTSRMFYGAKKYNQLSKFDVSAVTTMVSMYVLL